MDMNKERQAFERWWSENYDRDDFEVVEFSEILNGYESSEIWTDELNKAWSAWQAAKAQVPEWISVKDKKPNEYDRVLICNANIDDHEWNDGVTEAIFAPCDKGCCPPIFESKGHEYIADSEVTHWISLPKLPHEAQEQAQ